jgi:hypothetical protein
MKRARVKREARDEQRRDARELEAIRDVSVEV